MARRYFGTDGVRGVVGEDLTPELVEALGRAFARWQGGGTVLVGRDTRASGPALEAALAGGLADGGAAALLGGVLPTPAVALLAEQGGTVVSASHNPAVYNGVKFFSAGSKLADADEEAIEELLGAPGAGDGTIADVQGLAERYAELVCERWGRPLGGLRVACDCANGALSAIAPQVLARLGAAVVPVAVSPDGSNINEGCGATDLSLLVEVVRRERVDLGVAFDGDGDRLLAVDGDGCEVDGDQILAILALHRRVELVAVTTMTNLGFHKLMAEHEIRVVTTDVGDRYVLEALRREHGLLGGEQSGHVLWLGGHVTGDGLVAALLLCEALADTGRTLAEAAGLMPRFPQAKRNVSVRSKALPASLRHRLERLEEGLGGRGRLLVRPSGTEPVIRVLAEAESAEEAENLCATIGDLIQEELGAPQ